MESQLVSFDVESLYTNVPLPESINTICDYVFNDRSCPRLMPFTRNQLSKLLHIATQGIFSFNNKIYKQVDGVSMGNPLAPLIADFFMGYRKNVSSHHPKFSSSKPITGMWMTHFAFFKTSHMCSNFFIP